MAFKIEDGRNKITMFKTVLILLALLVLNVIGKYIHKQIRLTLQIQLTHHMRLIQQIQLVKLSIIFTFLLTKIVLLVMQKLLVRIPVNK
jgi:hypothetical protein